MFLLKMLSNLPQKCIKYSELKLRLWSYENVPGCLWEFGLMRSGWPQWRVLVMCPALWRTEFWQQGCALIGFYREDQYFCSPSPTFFDFQRSNPEPDTFIYPQKWILGSREKSESTALRERVIWWHRFSLIKEEHYLRPSANSVTHSGILLT